MLPLKSQSGLLSLCCTTELTKVSKLIMVATPPIRPTQDPHTNRPFKLIVRTGQSGSLPQSTAIRLILKLKWDTLSTPLRRLTQDHLTNLPYSKKNLSHPILNLLIPRMSQMLVSPPTKSLRSIQNIMLGNPLRMVPPMTNTREFQFHISLLIPMTSS